MDLFSLTAMFILFRETLEAAVVISVMLQLCTKMKLQRLQKWGTLSCSLRAGFDASLLYPLQWAPQNTPPSARSLASGTSMLRFIYVTPTNMCVHCAVWAGALAGVGVAIVIGSVFIVLFFVAKRTIFEGAGQNIFYGFLMLLASFMLTFLAFAMLKVKGYEEKWRLKLEAATEVTSALHPIRCEHLRFQSSGLGPAQ